MKDKNFTIRLGAIDYMFFIGFAIPNYELQDTIFINKNNVDEAERLREYLISNGWTENEYSDKIEKEIDPYDNMSKAELIKELKLWKEGRNND